MPLLKAHFLRCLVLSNCTSELSLIGLELPKKLTVNGTIGKTQGVSSAANPAPNAKRKKDHSSDIL